MSTIRKDKRRMYVGPFIHCQPAFSLSCCYIFEKVTDGCRKHLFLSHRHVKGRVLVGLSDGTLAIFHRGVGEGRHTFSHEQAISA